MRKLVLFDFDGTITTKDSFFEFIKFTNFGVYYYTGLFFCIPFFLLYALRIFNEKNLKEKILSYYFRNEQKDILINQGKLFVKHMIETQIIKNEFIELIKTYKDGGADIAVVSASLDIWIQPFCDIYEINCLCTQTEYSQENIFNGKIRGNNCKGIEKQKKVLSQFDIKNYSQIIVYGDSSGDYEMMKLGHEKIWVR